MELYIIVPRPTL